MFDPIIPDYRSWDRRKTNYATPHAAPLNLNQKYKTLEPRSKSGGDAHSLERLSNGRRVLPDVPHSHVSHSLPRQGKRTQSDSRQKCKREFGLETLNQGEKHYFSQTDNRETDSIIVEDHLWLLDIFLLGLFNNILS